MNRKVLDFDITSVDPEIAARCREILEDFELEDIQEVSPALGTFYVWVNLRIHFTTIERKSCQTLSLLLFAYVYI